MDFNYHTYWPKCGSTSFLCFPVAFWSMYITTQYPCCMRFSCHNVLFVLVLSPHYVSPAIFQAETSNLICTAQHKLYRDSFQMIMCLYCVGCHIINRMMAHKLSHDFWSCIPVASIIWTLLCTSIGRDVLIAEIVSVSQIQCRIPQTNLSYSFLYNKYANFFWSNLQTIYLMMFLLAKLFVAVAISPVIYN